MRPHLTSATAVAVLLLPAVLELLHRRGVPADITRRLAHVAGAGMVAFFPFYLGLMEAIVLAALFTVFLTVTAVRRSLASVHGVKRPTLGAFVLPAGCVFAALAVWERPLAFAYAMLILALADPAAATAGERLRSPGWKVIGGRKSLAGSLAFFSVAISLGWLFTVAAGTSQLPVALTAALVLASVEGLLGYGLDNLFLPPLAGLLGWLYLGL